MPMSIRPRLRFALTSFCLGMIALHLVVLWLARHQIMAGLPDFRIFYTAGLMLRRGQGEVLYSDSLQLRTQREFVPAASGDDGPLPYNHPPFEALLYLPFTYLSYPRAYSLWFLVNLTLLAASVQSLRQWLPMLQTTFPVLRFMIPLAFFPVVYALMQGQDSILLLALYTWAYTAFRRRADLRAGIYLGSGLFKFHLVLPFALILLLLRRWRAGCGILLTALLEFAVSWVLVGWKELLYYPRYTWHIDRLQPLRIIVPANMPNLRGLLTGWVFLTPRPRWLGFVLLAVSLLAVVWAARWWKEWDFAHVDGWNTGFSIALVVTFLVGYHGYNQDMSMLLLPILITMDRMLQPGWAHRAMGLKLVLGLMFLSPLYLPLTLHYFHQNLFALVLLMFVASLVAYSSTATSSAAADNATPVGPSC